MSQRSRISKDSDISKEVQSLLKFGWTFASGRKHGKLRSPSGYRIMIPTTPGGPTALRELRSEIRRALEYEEKVSGGDSG